MKPILIFALTLFSTLTADACMCSNFPLDPTPAIVQAARVASRMGRGATVDAKDGIEAIKAYPTLGERLNLFGFKGTNCEVIVHAKSTYRSIRAKAKSVTCTKREDRHESF